jgi:hypothetical protein
MLPGRLFVVVSTGQNVANLPPLLEHAQAGDRVVWVESAEARKKGWSRGAKVVLARRGFEALADIHVEEIDDLGALVTSSQAAVEEARRQQLRPHLILNGGQKLTPQGLLRAWGHLDPVLLYGEQQPAVCKTYPATLDRAAQVHSYTRHTLDLPEILEASDHQIFGSEGSQFWPGPLAADVAGEAYGLDPVYTAELHRGHHLRREMPAEDRLPGYPAVRQADASAVREWKQALLAPLRKRGLTMGESEDGVFELIYNRTLGLARAGALTLARVGQVPLPQLGPAFERGVARRVHAWLQAVSHPAIQSAWRGVKVASQRDPARVRAEFDVLLVLKSGVLWHLECKSFTADNKDLDARLFNLQQAGSQLARMVLCGPLYTGFVGEAWFAGQHDLRHRVEALRHFSFVPFTLPGQPESYVLEGEAAQTFGCPTLEATLDGVLRGYRLPEPRPEKETGP